MGAELCFIRTHHGRQRVIQTRIAAKLSGSAIVSSIGLAKKPSLVNYPSQTGCDLSLTVPGKTGKGVAPL